MLVLSNWIHLRSFLSGCLTFNCSYHIHHRFCPRYFNDLQSENREKIRTVYFEPSFSPDLSRVQHFLRKRQGWGPSHHDFGFDRELQCRSDVERPFKKKTRCRNVILNKGRESKSKPRCLFEVLYTTIYADLRDETWKRILPWLAGNFCFWEICYSCKTI